MPNFSSSLMGRIFICAPVSVTPLALMAAPDLPLLVLGGGRRMAEYVLRWSRRRTWTVGLCRGGASLQPRTGSCSM